MNMKDINQILADTAYPRIGGTPSEKAGADYLICACKALGLTARLQTFPRTLFTVTAETLTADGRQIPCAGYYGSACGTVEGAFYYLQGTDTISLKKCKDKIVLTDKKLDHKLYDLLAANGAKGCITYSGNVYFPDRDLERRDIFFTVPHNSKMPAVHIHSADAITLVKSGCKRCSLTVEQAPYPAQSQNVLLDLPGESEETVIVSAHYDSTALSDGAYDNMSGCIVLLYLAEYFSRHPHHRNIRLLWCGSEESDLVGSLAYCRDNDLEKAVLNINLDMLGCVMGEFVAFSCADEKMQNTLESFLKKHRIAGSVRYGIRASDSNSFAYYGVPAVSFARYAPAHTATIHTRYDTKETVSAKQLLADAKYILRFTDSVVNTPNLSYCVSPKIKESVDAYMERKLWLQG